MQRKIHGQMSESFLIAGILSISGGLQDAYTYMYRGKCLPMHRPAISCCWHRIW